MASSKSFTIQEFRALKNAATFQADGCIWILDLSEFSHPGPPTLDQWNGGDITREFKARQDGGGPHTGKNPLDMESYGVKKLGILSMDWEQWSDLLYGKRTLASILKA